MDLIKLFQKTNPRELDFKRAMSGIPSGNGFAFTNGTWVMLPESYSSYIDNGFKSIPYIYGIVDHIAEKFSDAPRSLMEITNVKCARAYDVMIKGAKSPKDFFMAKTMLVKAMRTVDESHPYYTLMNNPNPITPTEKSFNYARCGYLALTGNNYAFAITTGLGPNPDAPKQWHIIPSPTCAPVVNKSIVDPISGYRVSYFEDDIPIDKIQHVKLSNFTSASHNIQETLIGMSPLRPLLSTMSQVKDSDKANGLSFSNMSPAGIISGEGTDELTEQQGMAIQEGFLDRHQNKESWKKIIVNPSKVNWTKIGFSPIDLQILEFMDKAEERIAKVYHYPLGLLNSQGEVANETINSRRMITDAVLPYIKRFDDADTQAVRAWYKNPKLKVVTDVQYFPELQEDMTRVATWLKDAYWLTIQEKREVMDFQAEWDGTMLVPGSYETIDNIITPQNLDGGESSIL